MSKKNDTNNLEDLFADALKAVESIEEKGLEIDAFENIEIELDEIDLSHIELDEMNNENDGSISSAVHSPSSPSSHSSRVTSSLLSEITALQEEKAMLEQKYQKAMNILRKRKEQQEELETRNTQLQHQLMNQHKHVQDYRSQLSKMRDQFNDARKNLENQEGLMKDLKESVGIKQQQLDRATALRKKEQEQFNKFGALDTINKLLPCLDSLHLAQNELHEAPDYVAESIRVLIQQFDSTLNGMGVQRLSAPRGTTFDPTIHEALMRLPSEDVATNHIIDTYCDAYLLNGRLIRAAKVTVSSGQS